MAKPLSISEKKNQAEINKFKEENGQPECDVALLEANLFLLQQVEWEEHESNNVRTRDRNAER